MGAPRAKAKQGQVDVRAARAEDAEALAETAIAAWREGFRGIVPDHVDPSRAWGVQRVAKRIAARGGDRTQILAAELDGAVRGLLLLGPSHEAGAPVPEGEVIALYVHPDHWRKGLGRALVASALERLAVAGYRQAIVWTLAESPRNLAFYEALGFRRDGATQRRPSFGSPLEVRLRIRLEPSPAAGGR